MKQWNNNKYVIIKGFAQHLCNKDNFNFLEDKSILKEITPKFFSFGARHPAQDYLIEKKDIILEIVRKRFGINITKFNISGNMVTNGGGILIHNDWFHANEVQSPNAIVARGILTLNPSYVFGTRVYEFEDNDSYIREFGGYPGDLFIFKCTPDSWHSVGMKHEKHVNRYALNLTFFM